MHTIWDPDEAVSWSLVTGEDFARCASRRLLSRVASAARCNAAPKFCLGTAGTGGGGCGCSLSAGTFGGTAAVPGSIGFAPGAFGFTGWTSWVSARVLGDLGGTGRGSLGTIEVGGVIVEDDAEVDGWTFKVLRSIPWF